MKIGILTLPLHTNYGGIIQAYALMTVLKQMGHEVWLIDRAMGEKSLNRKVIDFSKILIKKYVLGKKLYLEVRKHDKLIGQHTDRFIHRYINPRTKRCFNADDLRRVTDSAFDWCIVGSDQVWRPAYVPNVEDYFFAFLEGTSVKRLAYAASFGKEDWEFTQDQTERCAALLQSFQGISAREDSAIEMCEKHFNVPAVHVLDPTMLLTVEDYLAIIEESEVAPSNGQIFSNVLDISPEKEEAISAISSHFGYSVFTINNRAADITIPVEERIVPPLESWLRGFYDAKFVVTDSFHSTVFSILFNKPFVVIGNKYRGMARFTSLLRMFGLENRLITSSSDLHGGILNEHIDWAQVNSILHQKRQESRAFLTSALGQ